MDHRIRSAALIVEGDAMLLVKHKPPSTREEWWVPPGGGLQTSKSLYQCAHRETFEETGLSVNLGDIVYIREFTDQDLKKHNIKTQH